MIRKFTDPSSRYYNNVNYQTFRVDVKELEDTCKDYGWELVEMPNGNYRLDFVNSDGNAFTVIIEPNGEVTFINKPIYNVLVMLATVMVG